MPNTHLQEGRLNVFLENVRQTVEHKHYFFGHMHKETSELVTYSEMKRKTIVEHPYGTIKRWYVSSINLAGSNKLQYPLRNFCLRL